MIAALLVPYLAAHTWVNGSIEGWQMAFLLTGAIGLIWLLFWFALYNTPANQKKLSAAEFQYIHSDEVRHGNDDVIKEKVPWIKLLSYRQTLSLIHI